MLDAPFCYKVRWGLTRQPSETISYGRVELMALLSELVRVVAEYEGMDEVSVGIFARHAREAGLISQGGRGRSAAKMTARDAANLLMAVNGCSLAKDVPTIVPLLRSLSCEGALFGDDFENLVSGMARKDRHERIGITYVRFFKPQLAVEITMYPGHAKTEGIKARYTSKSTLDTWPSPDRSDETVISHVTLQSVAKLIIN